MPPSKKPSIFEKKLRELEEQASLVESDIRSMQRVLKKPGSAELPSLRSNQPEPRRVEPPAPVEPLPPPPAPKMVEPPAPGKKPAPEGELFGADEVAAARAGKPAVLDTRSRKAPPGSERFASYLSSGSFGRSRPLTQEKRIQRNKAVFMLIFVALIAFLLIQAFR